MTKSFRPLPAPGEIVWCRFPEHLGVPGPKARPALVLGTDSDSDAVRVAYGTTKRVHEKFSGEFEITPIDGVAFAVSGLSYPTKFDFRKTYILPYTEEWFAVPPSPRHGANPKIGILHPSLMKRAEAAFKAANL